MPAVGKSGAGNDLDQFFEADLGAFEHRQAGVHHLVQVVRRNVGRHADRDAGRAVDQQIGDPRRQDAGLFLLAVVVGDEIDRFLVDIGKQALPRSFRAGIRCNDRRQRNRRRPSRNCPARRSACSASRNPAPCAPGRHRWPYRRADDICRARRRRCARISRKAGSRRYWLRAWQTACGDAPASGHRARRAARGPRSRSWRSRDRSGASPLRG